MTSWLVSVKHNLHKDKLDPSSVISIIFVFVVITSWFRELCTSSASITMANNAALVWQNLNTLHVQIITIIVASGQWVCCARLSWEVWKCVLEGALSDSEHPKNDSRAPTTETQPQKNKRNFGDPWLILHLFTLWKLCVPSLADASGAG